jgi:hypothetical protein
MSRFAFAVALLFLLTFAHGVWFLVQPEPCPTEVASCTGNPLPIYSYVVTCVLLNVGYAILSVRAGQSKSVIVNHAIFLGVLTLALMVVASMIVLRMFVAGHPT